MLDTDREAERYEEMRTELEEKYAGKVVVLHQGAVVVVCDDLEEAMEQGYRVTGKADFFFKRVVPNETLMMLPAPVWAR